MIRWLAFAILLIPFVLACPDDGMFRHELKKGLFDYIMNPERAAFTFEEISDLLTIYLSTQDISTLDCKAVVGARSGMTADMLLSKAATLLDTTIMRCHDGTEFGSCSTEKPLFCYSGALKEMCRGPDRTQGNFDDCGCQDDKYCTTEGDCV